MRHLAKRNALEFMSTVPIVLDILISIGYLPDIMYCYLITARTEPRPGVAAMKRQIRRIILFFPGSKTVLQMVPRFGRRRIRAIRTHGGPDDREPTYHMLMERQSLTCRGLSKLWHSKCQL